MGFSYPRNPPGFPNLGFSAGLGASARGLEERAGVIGVAVRCAERWEGI